ncbi:MMPL family transporter [Marininema halotolerans]|uniref:Putative drug exporter of the RND superfamily n=1 Tax=Marininema halotolerans TaxID=1155944 RepID=A0A1I6UH73_9BACL|nr:MMPL family transporter [Marininema halotolerans]SFT00836.1 putative drug exporter of the RND superfamily [Marininema halotolerans]
MRTVLKYKWVVMIVWVALLVLSMVTMPDLNEMTRETEPKIPKEFSSQVAQDLKKEMNNRSKSSKDVDVLAVFHSDKALTKSELSEIERGLDHLESDKKLGVSNLITHFNEEQLKDQFVSKDKSTVMALFTVDRSDKSIADVRSELKDALHSVSVEHYLTGGKLINDDYGQTTIKGVEKTELITVAFIIIVLIGVFRSPVAPIISLLSVGVSYITALSAIAHMVQWWGFPFANFTQIFLILVLFGVGTDYNILLFSRFKEELGQRKSVIESIIVTYRTAGKTVFYSSIAVIIGFACLAFARFSVYQAGVAVAIGVLFLVLSLLTVVPFFMVILNTKMFWPLKKVKGKSESRLWAKLSSFSYRRPLIALLIVAIFCVPMVFHQGKLSYNSLEEVDNSYESVKGFNIVSDEFEPGQTMPVEVILKNSDKKLDSPESLAYIDEVSDSLERIKGVKTVYGPTRPKGTLIDDAYVNKQTKKTEEGLGEAEKGTQQIKSGLDEAIEKMNGGNQDFSQVNQLVSGTKAAQNGVRQSRNGLVQIQNGLSKGASGASQMQAGLAQMQAQMQKMTAGLEKVNGGYSTLYGNYQGLEKGYKGIQMGLEAMNGKIGELKDASPGPMKEKVQELQDKSEELSNNLAKLNSGFSQANQKFSQANGSLNEVIAGQKKMTAALGEMEKQMGKLAEGLKEGSAGQKKVIDALGKIDTGLGKVAKGQQDLNNGLVDMSKSLKELQAGLSKSSKGLGDVNKGLQDAQDYLGEVAGTSATHTFFLPEETRTGKDFQDALDAYMSDDRHIMRWNVVLEGDPYSKKSMEIAGEIDKTIANKLQKTDYSNSKYGIGGVSSQNRDLNKLSTDDLSRTATFMLVGIGIVLLWMLRSFWNTVYIIVSLMIAYYSALSITELIFVNGLGHEGISWSAPFFSLIMVVSLGVDYSIFLMMRFLEYRDWSTGNAIVEATKRIGNVVFSAAIILSGTFASLYPSGILSLSETATVVIIGLFMMALLMLPLFLPALMSITRRLNTDPDASKEVPRDL